MTSPAPKPVDANPPMRPFGSGPRSAGPLIFWTVAYIVWFGALLYLALGPSGPR